MEYESPWLKHIPNLFIRIWRFGPLYPTRTHTHTYVYIELINSSVSMELYNVIVNMKHQGQENLRAFP